MKKWLFFLILARPLLALYMGNPSAPQIIEEGFFFCKENWFAVKAGYQRDWVFDRNLKGVSKVSGRLDDFESIADQGVLTVNLIDRIEVYGSAGAARFYAADRIAGTFQEYQSHDQFTWGVGLRGAFYEWKGLAFGIDGCYQQARPTIKWIKVNGAPVNPSSGSRMTFHEWQIGVGASYQVDLFIPYLGVKYSNAGVRFKHLPVGLLPEGRHFKAKNRRKFGLVLGTTLSTSSRFSATVEARLIDEQSITLAAGVKF